MDMDISWYIHLKSSQSYFETWTCVFDCDIHVSCISYPNNPAFPTKKDHIISRILRMRLEPPILFHREGVWILTGMMPALRALHPQPWSPDTWMISNLGLTTHSLYHEEDILATLKVYGTSRLCLEYLLIYPNLWYYFLTSNHISKQLGIIPTTSTTTPPFSLRSVGVSDFDLHVLLCP